MPRMLQNLIHMSFSVFKSNSTNAKKTRRRLILSKGQLHETLLLGFKL